MIRALFCFTIILPFNAWGEPVSSFSGKGLFPIIERDMINDQVKEYEAQLEIIENDILNLKMEQEWLYLKISAIQEQNRLPPQAFKESRRELNQKIAAAQAKKNRLVEFIQAHNADMEELKRKINNIGTAELVPPSSTPEERSAGEERSVRSVISDFEQELRDKLVKTGLDTRVEVSMDDSGLVMKSTVPILFDTYKFSLADEHRNFLAQLADFLKPYQVSIDVNGFSDYRKIKGGQMTNIELSAKRAGAVVTELKKRGMKPSIFKVAGMGEYKHCLEKNDKCRWLSRRADIIVRFVKNQK